MTDMDNWGVVTEEDEGHAITLANKIPKEDSYISDNDDGQSALYFIDVQATNISCSDQSMQFSDNEEKEFESEQARCSWTDEPTKLLISLYDEFVPMVGKSVKLKTKKKMWDLIALKFKERGYTFGAVQVENRWKTLERLYRKKTGVTNGSWRGRVRRPYEKELTESMINKLPATPKAIPEYHLDSENPSQNALEKKNEEMEPELTVPATSSLPNTVKTTRDISNTSPCGKNAICKELRLMRLLKETYNKEKLAAYARRTQELARKNDLLEKLISTLQEKNNT